MLISLSFLISVEEVVLLCVFFSVGLVLFVSFFLLTGGSFAITILELLYFIHGYVTIYYQIICNIRYERKVEGHLKNA